ncbi:MAG: hypothetical protein WCT47_15525 [Betaproteobacteria bacterium]|jgi:hypothetical protein
MGYPLNPTSAMLVSWAAVGALLPAPPAWAQEVARPVYRCPGPSVLYTDAISAQEARERGCRIIDGAPLTVMQSPRRPAPAALSGGAAPASSAPAATGTGASANRPEARVDPAVQRARDAEASRILTAELRREEERLEQLKREFNNGEPERRGDERNFALYQQRVTEMRALIGRKESDIAAIRRELGKLTQ